MRTRIALLAACALAGCQDQKPDPTPLPHERSAATATSAPSAVSTTGLTDATGTKPAEAPPVPANGEGPSIRGRIVFVGPWKTEELTVGFGGKGADGLEYWNVAGTAVTAGMPIEAEAPSVTDPAQRTVLANEEKGPAYRHTKVPPGEYLVYVQRNGVLAAWKKVAVKPGDQLTVDLTIDLSRTGEVAVTLSDDEANDPTEWNLLLMPFEFDPSGAGYQQAFNAAAVKKGQKAVAIKGVPAGKYRLFRGQSTGEVEVVAGKEARVTLDRQPAPK